MLAVRYLDDELLLGIEGSAVDKVTGAMIPQVIADDIGTNDSIYCDLSVCLSVWNDLGADVHRAEHRDLSSLGHAGALSRGQLRRLLEVLRLHQSRLPMHPS